MTNEWQAGYNAELTFRADHDAADWDIYLSFDKTVPTLQIWQGQVSTHPVPLTLATHVGSGADGREMGRTRLSVACPSQSDVFAGFQGG